MPKAKKKIKIFVYACPPRDFSLGLEASTLNHVIGLIVWQIIKNEKPRYESVKWYHWRVVYLGLCALVSIVDNNNMPIIRYCYKSYHMARSAIVGIHFSYGGINTVFNTEFRTNGPGNPITSVCTQITGSIFHWQVAVVLAGPDLTEGTFSG